MMKNMNEGGSCPINTSAPVMAPVNTAMWRGGYFVAKAAAQSKGNKAMFGQRVRQLGRAGLIGPGFLASVLHFIEAQ